MIKEVKTTNSAKAIGPYSQAVVAAGFVFCSGIIPISSDGVVIEGDIKLQVKQIFQNLVEILDAANSGLSKVVKVTIYLRDMTIFNQVNEVYTGYFENVIKPARSTVEVSNLPKNVAIELDCIALA